MFLNPNIRGLLAAAMTLVMFEAVAKEGFYFNPAFLGDDPSLIADLSRFEKGAENLPGIYRVDVFVNKNPAGTRELEFRTATESGELYPCLTRDMLTEFNIDPNVLPEISASQECLNIAEIVPVCKM